MEVFIKTSKEQLLTYQRRQPKFRNFELICLSLTAEFWRIDSENDVFRKLSKATFLKIKPCVYTRRRRESASYLNDIRLKLACYFNQFENYFTVDSMPLEVCELLQSSNSYNYSKTFKGFRTSVY